MKKILITVFCLLSISIFSQNTETVTAVSEILTSQGFTFVSFWRGALGMFSLIVIAFLFSANKKAIDWKKVAKKYAGFEVKNHDKIKEQLTKDHSKIIY